MDINVIVDELKAGALEACAKEAGISIEDGLKACEAFMPAIMGEIQGVMSAPEKMSAIMGGFMSGEYLSFLRADLDVNAAKTRGTELLETLFESKENVSEKINSVSKGAGLEAHAVSQFLPLISAALMGAVSKHAGSLLQAFTASEGEDPISAMLGGDLSQLADTFLKN